MREMHGMLLNLYSNLVWNVSIQYTMAGFHGKVRTCKVARRPEEALMQYIYLFRLSCMTTHTHFIIQFSTYKCSFQK